MAAWFSIGEIVSTSLKLRPITGPAPSVVKKSGEMRMTFSCWVEPVSPTTSVPSRKMERLEKAGMLPRRS